MIVCGAAHLPYVIARLIVDGFEINKANSDEVVPIDTQFKSMLFNFELERKMFMHLRTQIIEATSYDSYLEAHRHDNHNTQHEYDKRFGLVLKI